MTNKAIKLTVQTEISSVFEDQSAIAWDYARDSFTSLLTNTDNIYIGYEKPINAAYVEMSTASTSAGSFTMEYWNGTAWTVLGSSHDDTRAFRRSGFLKWDKPSDWAAVAVNSIEKYYIRLRPSIDFSAGTAVLGINLVLSDDNDLKREFPSILNNDILPPGGTTHILAHVSARDDIVQKIRNIGYQKKSGDSEFFRPIQVWDLLDVEEVRRASTYLALAKVFFQLSDSTDDIWWKKHLTYTEKFNKMNLLAALSIDSDDDGVEDLSENQRPFSVHKIGR